MDKVGYFIDYQSIIHGLPFSERMSHELTWITSMKLSSFSINYFQLLRLNNDWRIGGEARTSLSTNERDDMILTMSKFYGQYFRWQNLAKLIYLVCTNSFDREMEDTT